MTTSSTPPPTPSATAGFQGRIVAVTGAGGGIGSVAAAAFAEAGATVFGLDLHSSAPAGGITWLECDITDENTVAAAFARIRAAHGRLDVLVNNAAIGAKGSVETATDEEWQHLFEINVFGVARASRHALPLLRSSDAGAIVNIGSVTAVVGTPLRAVYSASKGAVAALTRAMAADLLDEGIRVNAIHPGPVLTSATGRYDDDRDAAVRMMAESQPLGHLIGAGEIAAAMLYLANPLNRSLTGTELRYDGALSEVVNVGTR